MQNKRKITGIGFNLFALTAVIILLPIGTATVSSLANANSTEYEDITTDNYIEMANDPAVVGKQITPTGSGNTITYDEAYALTWIDKGLNSTEDYMSRDSISSNQVERYESIWDESDIYYNLMSLYTGNGNYLTRDNTVFGIGVDNHRFLQGSHYLWGANPNYTGYIGYSGDEYSFTINTNVMKWVDTSRDISAIKITFIDHNTAFNCDAPIFQEVSTTADINILFNSAYEGLLLENFEFNQINSYEFDFISSGGGYGVSYNENNGQTTSSGTSIGGGFCHIGLEFEFDFTPIETIEIKELFQNDYPSMKLEITLKDFEFDNVTALNIVSGSSNAPIPFTGDDNFAYNFQVAYVDTVRTNFFLSGGTFVLGFSLFTLAVSNTQYWNPFVNFFKPKRP